VDPKTVRRYVAARDEGRPVTGPARRPRIIDPYLAKIEEWVDRSQGKVRADIVHERLEGVGFGGMSAPPAARWRRRRRRGAPVIGASAVGRRAGAAAALRLGQRSGGAGPGWAGAGDVAVLRVAGVVTGPGRDPELGRKLGTLLACLDGTPRRLGGVPTYALTDNEKTVTVENLAGVSVRHPAVVAAGRHYGVQVHTCVPFDPESKVGSEATVRIAKADLVSTEANLLAGYDSFADLAQACEVFCAEMNGRVHRETDRCPGRRGRAGRAGRDRAGRRRARDRRRGGTVRRRCPARHRRALRQRRPDRRAGGRRRDPLGSARHRRLEGVQPVNTTPPAPALPDELAAVLTRMRLPYLRDAPPEVVTAREQRWDPAEVLRVLIAEEIRGRDGATKGMRRKTAGLPAGKTFESWRETDSSIPTPTRPDWPWSG
jgi:hypothetical protein